jgi:hypothetical protein
VWRSVTRVSVAVVAALREAGGEVQESVAQRLGLTRLERSGTASRRSQAVRSATRVTTCSQAWLIVNSRDGNRPSPEFLAQDPVLPRKREVPPDAGVGAVPGFEERRLPDSGVGGERLAAPPVGFLEQRQPGAGVGCSRRMMTHIPGGQWVRSSRSSTAAVRALARTVAVAVRIWSVTANPTEYSRHRPRSVSQSSSPMPGAAAVRGTSSFLR